jgi:hypothetical protein
MYGGWMDLSLTAEQFFRLKLSTLMLDDEIAMMTQLEAEDNIQAAYILSQFGGVLCPQMVSEDGGVHYPFTIGA